MKQRATAPGGATWSEEHRHACEVRYVLAMPSREERAAYLDALPRFRGKAAAERLRADVAAAWRARRAQPAALSSNVMEGP